MSNEIVTKRSYTDEEKLKAAYALNMCTVSVSQIIDYNDLYILEQEYDAILNNLNLKAMPKDEALLRVLTELLNTITFFRIQELKKEQVEKQYQVRMKSAIWSAVPSLSVLVSGNPITLALSLATTIGTGYMNYRKEKANAFSDREKEEMELQISAIEQFNSLRRELFTTAWRLADEYDFDDRLRLTEKQIKQYNEILMDQDEFRKYARLEAIQDKFEAYPPFWYFFGHTAGYIVQTTNDIETKQYYLCRAKDHFEHYEKLNQYNILREDQMTASFALEYIDLLFLEKTRDNVKIQSLIKIAIDKAGNNKDVLQLCATSCLRIGERKQAARLLKILVNEDYNKVINAQLLSGIYVSERNRPEYNILTTRVSNKYLYPMPEADNFDLEELEGKFELQQKSVLKEKFKGTLQNIINKYSEEFNREISQFDAEENYPVDFFSNSKKSKRERVESARSLFGDETKIKSYIEKIRYVSLPLKYTNIFQKMYGNIFKVNCYNDPVLQDKVVEYTTRAIVSNKERINNIQEKIDSGRFGFREYEQLQKIGLIEFIGDSFEKLYQYAAERIDNSDLDDLRRLEGNLMKLCSQMDLNEPEIAIDPDECKEVDFSSINTLFDVSLFGAKAVVAKNNADYIKEMTTFVKEKMQKISIKESELKVIYRDQIEFERYFNNSIFEEYCSLKPNSIMVIADATKNKFDLIFTTEGIVYVIKNKVRKKAPYENIQFSKDALDLYGKKYRSKSIDVGALYELVKELDKKFINNLEQKMDYYDGVVSAKILNEWFRKSRTAMSNEVTRVYAWPERELLQSMGYHIASELSKEHYLLQFYCELKTGNILGLRVIEFENLDSDFQQKLYKAGGVIRVER